MKDWISLTREEAVKSHYLIPGRRTGCLLVKGNKVISRGFNKMKNRMSVSVKTVHAEIDAINKIGLNRGERFNILVAYIFRWKGGISKPCLSCWINLKLIGVRKIVYEGSNGEIFAEKV